MKVADKDFVSVDFDIYANGELVQTTDEKKGKAAKLDVKEFKPQVIIAGKNFVLKAMDQHMLKNEHGKSHKLKLKAEEAYGKKQKDLIRTFPKKAFDENKMRAVVGITYDFNGMYGTVKAVTGGRVLVDFNNPLVGKEIELEYKVNKKVEDIIEKIVVVFESVLRIPSNMFEVNKKEKEITIKVPEQLAVMKDALVKSLEELISDIKDYKIKVESIKNK